MLILLIVDYLPACASYVHHTFSNSTVLLSQLVIITGKVEVLELKGMLHSTTNLKYVVPIMLLKKLHTLQSAMIPSILLNKLINDLLNY